MLFLVGYVSLMPSGELPSSLDTVFDSPANICFGKRLSVSKLNLYRLKGSGSKFQKFGRSVRYMLADVMAFMEAPTYASTSEINPARAKRDKSGEDAAA